MTPATLENEGRRVRSQLARPLDRDWTARYNRIHQWVPEDLTDTIMIRSPSPISRQAVAAGLNGELKGLITRPGPDGTHEAIITVGE